MAQGRGVDFVELAGVGQDELRNCSLLAWLNAALDDVFKVSGEFDKFVKGLK